MKCVVLLAVFACACALTRADHTEGKGIEAECVVDKNSGLAGVPVEGKITFQQKNKYVQVKVDLTGFDSSDAGLLHGLHIHKFGALSDGCKDAGGHYNPLGVNHGARDNDINNRHIGDLGNIKEDKKGQVKDVFKDEVIQLSGDYSVIGRAVVIHADEDDLGLGGDEGSLSVGNAGARLACCLITQVSGDEN